MPRQRVRGYRPRFRLRGTRDRFLSVNPPTDQPHPVRYLIHVLKHLCATASRVVADEPSEEQRREWHLALEKFGLVGPGKMARIQDLSHRIISHCAARGLRGPVVEVPIDEPIWWLRRFATMFPIPLEAKTQPNRIGWVGIKQSGIDYFISELHTLLARMGEYAEPSSMTSSRVGQGWVNSQIQLPIGEEGSFPGLAEAPERSKEAIRGDERAPNLMTDIIVNRESVPMPAFPGPGFEPGTAKDDLET